MHYNNTKEQIWAYWEIRTQQAWQTEKVSRNLTQGAETQLILEVPLS